MSWTYQQSTGLLTGHGARGVGYAGKGQGKNNPAAQAEHNVGPIPQGAWKIVGPPVDTPLHGPFVLRLLPRKGTETCGRSGFLIHGDSRVQPGTASEGCIIQPRDVREAVWASKDDDLKVIA